MDEPRTPPIDEHSKDAEPELELDLESLGLDDREIPHDKIIKEKKIGSGGFKDVFTGRFKGRKVAIAEFRDQLSASMSCPHTLSRLSDIDLFVVDIKELKLLGDFDHPNIVRFVCRTALSSVGLANRPISSLALASLLILARHR